MNDQDSAAARANLRSLSDDDFHYIWPRLESKARSVAGIEFIDRFRRLSPYKPRINGSTRIYDRAAALDAIPIPKPDPVEMAEASVVTEAKPLNDKNAPEPLIIPSVSTWEGRTPPARAWTWEGWIPAGRVTSLNGDGGTGKSITAQTILTACSSARGHLYDIPMSSGTALGIFCEEEQDELERRQIDICASLGIPIANLDNLHLLSRVGKNNLLVTYHEKLAMPTEFYWQVDATCELLRPHLVVIDPAADAFGGNPIDQAEVRQFVQFILGGLCDRYSCTVLLPMHPSAAGIASGDGGGFSVAWSNSVRSRIYQSHPKVNGQPDYARVTLSRKKSNYAARGEELHLTYHHGAFDIDTDPEIVTGTGILKPVDMQAYTVLAELSAAGHCKFSAWADECKRRGIVKADTEEAREKALKRTMTKLVGGKLASKGEGLRGYYRAVTTSD